MRISVTFTNEDGNEVTAEFPAKMEVCENCKGTGHVLCDGMRGHAYTSEEFSDFSEEEQGEYFKVGGRYDMKCPDCKGQNVIKVVDEDNLSEDEKKDFAEYESSLEEKARYIAECNFEQRMGA